MIIVYGSSLSPFVRKVLAFAAEKGIAVDLQPTGFPDRSAEFCEASPFNKMPAIRDGDYCLSDSTAIVHYLEAKHPEPALIPREPELLGKTIWFEEFSDTIMSACGAKMFFNRIVAPKFMGREGDLAAADAAERDELPPILDYLERVVPEGDGFLVGDSLTLADIAVASPFANFRHMNTVLDPERYRRTIAYVARILDRPSFKAMVERETAILEKVPA
ncbi:MAG TPA: glutathione S-transferase family protein [Sphingomicrobium sp.]|nr:glutathione S-transferase family protein [Sphingomicrobium sp.]